ncbi:hypothetical protein Godav_015740 [Gossypium davidsonii]|uniref:Outer envelope pore protein 16-3, chloroplastic/mitochondrial n=2 Tax=Gossypium TaxID=3633 RepID=A0A7J8RP26_GOSDV|nr:hypothetical protein [Gossypium davidsonii]
MGNLGWRELPSFMWPEPNKKISMDPSELRYYEDDDTPTMKTIKGATTGFVAGTIWGTVVATWYDVPRVERSVALPGLVRTLKMMGNYGMTFAAIGGVYIGVEQLLQNYRMKRSFVNGAVGGFVAGASILGFKGKYLFRQLEYLVHFKTCYLILLICKETNYENMTDMDDGFLRKLYLFKIEACDGSLDLHHHPYNGAVHFAGRSISTAISAGTALAVTSAVIDAGGQTTRIDTGKEYYPYTTKKRPADS